jgi:predicted Fe-Mo cluster-binding NifX family protein
MKIAVTSTGGSMNSLVSERFGRCPYFLIYDTETEKFQAVSNLGEQRQNGAGPKAAEMLINNNVDMVITGSVGDKAEQVLNKEDIKIVTGYDEKYKVKDVVEKYL